MILNKDDALSFMEENDVQFIRLQFCDIFGTLKNISITPEELEHAFADGIGFDASSIKGFLNENESDLLLFPNPSTMSVLPWRPQTGRVVRLFCDIKRPDGTHFEGDIRRLLKEAVKNAQSKGFHINIGSECEFYLFETDEKGNPTTIPHDNATYFAVAPADKGENVRREICLTLKEMGLMVQSSMHEKGMGQHEIIFKHADALNAADHMISFKTVVKTIAGKNGLYASFMPKPLNHVSGNGLHVNISIIKDGINVFEKKADDLSPIAKSFLAGILAHIKGITAFTNPVINSYKRLGCGFEAPKYISWHFENRSQLVRIPSSKGAYSRMELRSPDPACNPYLAFLLLISAGLEGIEKNLTLSAPGCGKELLPQSLSEAINYALADKFIADTMGEATFEKYIAAKLSECEAYNKTVHHWEIENYFRAL